MHVAQRQPQRGFPADQQPRQGTKITKVSRDAFNRIMEEVYGVKSNLAVAEFLGCSEGTISRVRSEDQKPGNSFVGAVMASVTRDEFFEIFYTEDAQRAESVTA